MKITSPVFSEHDPIPTVYTCDGSDTSPPLEFSDIPEQAQSLALIMEDPDVPQTIRKDGMWDHWIVFNIPADTRKVVEGVEPEGVHGAGTSGNLAYHGPCPPDKEHRYIFKLFALDILLDLPKGASKQEVEQAMQGHVLEKAELVGVYERH